MDWGFLPMTPLNREPVSIGVLIASYRRPAILLSCLRSLTQQIRLPDDVIVVVREDDAESLAMLAETAVGLPLTVIRVTTPGTVAARNAGLGACRTDVLCVLDDDTEPQPQWLEVVLRRFVEDPTLGGLGGRDRCFDGKAFDDRQEAVVGRIQWCGRMIGNHHLGFGGIREVDFLKGANMSFRAEAFENVRFDTRLKGRGAQPREDTAFSVAVKAAGWKLAYDPAAVVDHYAAVRDEARHYVDVQALKDEQSFREFSYNDIVAIWPALSGGRRAAFVFWSVLVGTGVCPGLVQAIRYTPRLGAASWRRFFVAQQGKFMAFRELLFA
jgi:GT2 family glycosyltransferase